MAAADLPLDPLDDDQNSDDGLELDPVAKGQPASTVREQRRAQKQIFESWIASEAGQQAIRTKVKAENGKDLSTAADEDLSIQSLMQRQGETIIKNPRDYQRELFERAKTQNTIAVLDTGSGKTLIAVMLIRWMIDQELELRAAGHLPKIAFFLVASVTLVFQQFSVLDTNLDHPVARISGADKADNWNSAKWEKMLAENKVIICTADILQQALALSFVRISQINLLVFDEAHHTKKNHAYARIVKDYYLQEPDPKRRPRVFGMTASPIDAKTDVIQAASELEGLLDSKIATSTDMSFQDAVKRPSEQILRYDALRKPFETELLRATKAQFGHIQVLSKVYDACPLIARELGSWCADQHLVDRLSDENLRGYTDKIERKFYERRAERSVAELDAAVAEVQAAFQFVRTSGLRVDQINVSSDYALYISIKWASLAQRRTTNILAEIDRKLEGIRAAKLPQQAVRKRDERKIYRIHRTARLRPSVGYTLAKDEHDTSPIYVSGRSQQRHE